MVSSDYNSKQIVELDRSKWDYVPSIGLWVAKEKILFGRVSFYNAQKKLYYSNNQKIPTIPEFREFLKYTKENEFRRHVAMIFEIDGKEDRFNIDKSYEYYEKTNKFINYYKNIIENNIIIEND